MKREILRPAVAAAMCLSVPFLSGCDARDGASGAQAPQEAPSVAPTMPATVMDPAATAALRTFDGRDGNRDGLLSGAENGAAEAQIFRAIDADGDGSMGVQELDRARVALGLLTLPGSEELISQADQDGNGQLTLAEWIAHESESFDAADTNRDGQLTRSEFSVQPRLEPSAMPAPPETQETAAGVG